MKLRGMIVTVGASPEPLIKTLDEHAPQFVLFIVSAESRKTVEKGILPELSQRPRDAFCEVADSQLLADCYLKIHERIGTWLEEYDLNRKDVGVDYTGGTKAMTAALALASVERSIDRFIYVGGTERDYTRRGVVLDGFEIIKSDKNPLRARAVREIERANWLLGHFHAGSAAKILKDAKEICDEKYNPRLDAYVHLAEALDHADRFQFGQAIRTFSQRRKELSVALEGKICDRLWRLCDEGWKKIDESLKSKDKTPDEEVLHEVLANAERRAKQGRYDDAVARLYRAIEMKGQQLVAGLDFPRPIELGKLCVDDLPADRRDNIMQKLQEQGDQGYILLGVQKLYKLLEIEGDDRHIIYRCLRELMVVRNQSLLAHGLVPVSHETFQKFWNRALSAMSIEESDIPRWPDIELRLPP